MKKAREGKNDFVGPLKTKGPLYFRMGGNVLPGFLSLVNTLVKKEKKA